jgi:hypothetical protein
MLNINANLIKRSKNKERFANSCEAIIIIEVIIIVINCFKDILFCQSKYI